MITITVCDMFLCSRNLQKTVGVCNKKIIPLLGLLVQPALYKFNQEGAKFISKFVMIRLHSKRYWIEISPHSLRVLSTFDKIRDFSCRKFSSQMITGLFRV